ncbi:uncharacterized protein LOC120006001 [Tripterygium wilfordii]|uniref:uncharacterized protein LOC120006001 n=1 Tax=Tripterygium wilfordii TaxID=458696 RepID=UPI0018F8473F|nr:uncharacterized protein LOC120006001 [Tripterygium wilfordii]
MNDSDDSLDRLSSNTGDTGRTCSICQKKFTSFNVFFRHLRVHMVDPRDTLFQSNFTYEISTEVVKETTLEQQSTPTLLNMAWESLLKTTQAGTSSVANEEKIEDRKQASSSSTTLGFDLNLHPPEVSPPHPHGSSLTSGRGVIKNFDLNMP